jgi:hypothetical protein
VHQLTVCRASAVLSALTVIAYDGAYICFAGLFILPKIADSGSKKILAYTAIFQTNRIIQQYKSNPC